MLTKKAAGAVRRKTEEHQPRPYRIYKAEPASISRKARCIKAVAAVVYMTGFLLAILSMIAQETLGTPITMELIEWFMVIFIIGAVALIMAELWESWE